MNQFENFERKIISDSFLDKAHEKAKTINHGKAINPDDFRDIYGDDNVNKDAAETERLLQKFSEKYAVNQEDSSVMERNKKQSEIMEALLFDQVQTNNWLGVETEAIKTCNYDDFINHVDLIAEISEQSSLSHLGLAMDATVTGELDNKIELIKKEIDSGELGRIKYFKSENANLRGELKNLPRVIICLTGKTVSDLTELWLEGQQKDMADHPAQFQILEEIILQLKTFENYAASRGMDKLATRYQRARNLVQRINHKKIEEAEINRLPYTERDNAIISLESSLRTFFPETKKPPIASAEKPRSGKTVRIPYKK